MGTRPADSYWGVAIPQLLMATGGLADWGSRVGPMGRYHWEGSSTGNPTGGCGLYTMMQLSHPQLLAVSGEAMHRE